MKGGLQALAMAITLVSPMLGQQFNDFGRERAREMLRRIAEDVKKHYYDPKFHGLDFDDRVRQADEKLRQATSVTESLKAWNAKA